MKRKLVIVVSVAAVACTAGLGQLTWKSRPANPPPAEKPHYLLVLRYWGSVMRQQGDMAWGEQDWVTLTETYKTLDEVKARLAQPCGFDETSIVGLWDLTKAPELKIKTWLTTNISPARVEEQKYEQRHWDVLP